MIAVRPFRPADADACCAIVNAAIAEMDGLNPAARALVIAKNGPADLAADLGACHAVVAEGPQGLIVGLGALAGSEIKRVYVRPDAHRRGTGRLLLEALETEAARRGEKRLTLQASLSSVPFYLALGYQRLGDDVTRNGEAEFRHVAMAKHLADQDPQTVR